MRKYLIFLLLAISTYCYEIFILDSNLDENIPVADQRFCAIDSTGRFWTTGNMNFTWEQKPLYSYDGHDWIEYETPVENVHDIVVDTNNVLWLPTESMHNGAIAYDIEEGQIIYDVFRFASLSLNPSNGTLWAYGQSMREEDKIWQFNGVEFEEFIDILSVWGTIFGTDGRYCVTRHDTSAPDRYGFDFYDYTDSLLGTFYLEPTWTLMSNFYWQNSYYNATDELYYFIIEDDSTRNSTILGINCDSIVYITDSCSVRRWIYGLNIDNNGNLIYDLSSSSCRPSGVYICYEDDTVFISYEFLGHCTDIEVDPYTNNIWICCTYGFIIYNEDSVWFDIHEYGIKENAKKIKGSSTLRTYPNPAIDEVYIDETNTNPIYIHDLNGRLIDKLLPGQNRWLTGNIETGTYILHTNGENGIRKEIKIEIIK